MITAAELNLVENALRQATASDIKLLDAASDHVIGSGGKRLRPTLVLLSFKSATDRDVSLAVPLAAAVELLHTASLVHDDINDQSSLRRGQATVNAQWGDSLALLVGDFVFVRLLRLIAGFAPRAIRVLADSCTAIVEGETLQMLHQRDLSMTEETYLRIVTLKTAKLFSACSELGAFVGGGTEEHIAALHEYGLNLGIAFQIRDDVLDWIGEETELGKPIASDLQQGKMSLATIFALQQSKVASQVLFAGDGGRALRLLQDVGALDYAMSRCQAYSERAQKALVALHESEIKTELSRLARYAVTRDR
jgi:geranylgeranyl pyrophosphate synthase